MTKSVILGQNDQNASIASIQIGRAKMGRGIFGPAKMGRGKKTKNAPCTQHHVPSTMHHVPSTMYHAPCTMHHVPKKMGRGKCTMHHAPCTMHHAPCTMQHAPFHRSIPLHSTALHSIIIHTPRLLGLTWA